MKPPVPYRGNEPYIFISYSHKDSRKVWPVIEQMQADGYRVWYDEGIDPGTEWDENIAAHVTGCEYFIAFISKNYINSENCKDELNFSRDLGKKQLLIYLEEAELPEGMGLRFGRCQTLHKNGKGDFYQRLYDAEGISAFTNGEKIAVKKKKFNPLVLIPLALLAAAGLFFMKPAHQPETTTAQTTEAAEDPFALRQESLLSKNDITLKTHDMYIDEEGNLILDVLAENKNDTNIDLFIDTTYINGKRCESQYDHTLPASAESHIFLKWSKEYLERDVADVIEKPEDVTKIQVKMTTKGFPDYQYFTYYPYGRENDNSDIFEPGENDIVIHDDDNTRIVIANPHYNEENDWVIDIVSTNKSDRMTKIYTSFRDVNGYAYGPGCNEEMFPDSTVVTNCVYSEWEATQKDKVYRATVHIAIQDIETYEMFEEKDVEVWFEEDTGITFEPRILDSDDKILIENEDIVVALIDTFEYNKAHYAFRLYGYNKSDKELDIHFENYHKNGELEGEGFWSIMYLHPDTQSFDTQFINHENDVTSGNTDFDLVIEESTGGGDSVELYRKKSISISAGKSEVNILERPISYEGNENYIFISYSHKDSARVWPIISRMQKDGFRIWYDDGINPGTEWDENIASHVKNCSFFIAFMSENYLASENCKDELNYSRDLDKQQLIIYLDKVDLPPALAMRIGRNQAIMKYGLNDDEFYDKIYNAKGIEYQHKDNKTPKITLERPQEVHVKTKDGRKNILPLLIAILLVAAIAGGIMWPKGNGEESGAADNLQTEKGELKEITSVEVYDDKNLNIKALGVEKDSRYVTLKLAVENKGRADAFLSNMATYINGVSFDPSWTGTLPAEETSLVEMAFSVDKMKKYGVDPENITMVETSLDGRFTDDSAQIYTDIFAYYPYGEENAMLNGYEVQEGDKVLLDNEEALVVARDSELYADSGYRFQEIIFVNRCDEYKALSMEQEAVNGYLIKSYRGTGAEAGHTSYFDAVYDPEDLEVTGYAQLLEYSGELFIHDIFEDYKSDSVTHHFDIYPEGEDAAKALEPRQLEGDELIYEDEYFRIGYLGCVEGNEGVSDVFYLFSHWENNRYIDLHLTWQGGGYGSYSGVTFVPGGKQLIMKLGRNESVDAETTGHLSIKSSEHEEIPDETMPAEAALTMRVPE